MSRSIFFLALFTTSILCRLVSADDLLVGHWKFDALNAGETSTPATNQVLKLEGHLNGGVGIPNGTSRDALNFPGENGDYLQIGNDATNSNASLIQDGSDFTISLWINPKNEVVRRQMIFGRIPGYRLDQASYWLELEANGRFLLGLGNGTTYNLAEALSDVIEADTWTHLTVVKEKTGQDTVVTSYVNGKRYRVKTLPGVEYPQQHLNPKFDTWRELVGSLKIEGGLNFEGQIDDLRIWSTARHPGPTNPDSHWEFEGDVNLKDSVSGNHGSLQGDASPTIGHGGQPGEALELDGDEDYAQIGGDNVDPLIPDGSDFTISVWINPDDPSGPRQMIYGHFGGNSIQESSYWLEIHPTKQRLLLGLGTGPSYIIKEDMSPVIKAGEWTHITVVKEGSQVKSYINGVYYRNWTLPSADYPNKCTALEGSDIPCETIGSMGKNRLCFDGRIDDLRVWHTPLSEPNVKEAFYDSMWKLNEWPTPIDGNFTSKANDAFLKLRHDNKFVLLDSGEYIAEDKITLGPETTLYGRKNGTTLETTIINGSSSSPANTADAILDIGSFCQVSDLKIDGDGNPLTGIVISNKKEVLVQNCDVFNMKRNDGNMYGLYVRMTGTPSGDGEIKIKDCNFKDIGTIHTTDHGYVPRGIMVASEFVEPAHATVKVFIDNCSFSDIRSTSPVLMGDCIQIQSVKDPDYLRHYDLETTITNCKFSNFEKRGIKIKASKVYVYDNDFYDVAPSFRTAIDVFGSDCVVKCNEIDAGQVVSPSSYGIMLAGDNNQIRHNNIVLPDDRTRPCSGVRLGFAGRGVTNNVVADNTIEGGFYGVSIWADEKSSINHQHQIFENVLGGNDITINQTTPWASDNTLWPTEYYKPYNTPTIFDWNFEEVYEEDDRVLHGSRIYESKATHADEKPIFGGSAFWEDIKPLPPIPSCPEEN